MTDSIKLEMTQVDDSTGQAISKVVCDWYGMDRDTANSLSMALTIAVTGALTEMAAGKAQMNGNEQALEALKSLRKQR